MTDQDKENKEYTFDDAIVEVAKTHGTLNWTYYQAAELYKTKGKIEGFNEGIEAARALIWKERDNSPTISELVEELYNLKKPI